MHLNSHRHTYTVIDTPKDVTIETVIARAPVIDIDTVRDAVIDILNDIVIIMNVVNAIVIAIVSHSHGQGNSYTNTIQQFVTL